MELCGGRRRRRQGLSTRFAGEGRVRRVSAKSQQRLSAFEETLLPLYTGNGRTHHGNSPSAIFEGRGLVYFRAQERRHAEGCHNYLRGGLDAAQFWHAD